MKNMKPHHVVAGRFEAARQIKTEQVPLKACRPHGHGFQVVAVCSAIKDAQAQFDALDQVVQSACGLWDYQDLNRVLGDSVDNRSLLGKCSGNINDPSLRLLQLETEPGLISVLDLDQNVYRVANTFEFEAAHQLPHVPPGHKCGRMHGHGFSVRIECSVPDSMLMESMQAKVATAWIPLFEKLQWSCLNDIPGLENPTSEHLALWLWEALQSLEGLVAITVNETPTAGCCFDGQKMRIWKEQTFDSAVKLINVAKGDPRRAVHGHTFKTRLHLTGSLDQALGWVYDYGDVKEVFRPLFDALDHRALYDMDGLEHADDLILTRYIYDHLKPQLALLSGVDIEHRPHRGAWLVEQGSRHDL